MSERVLVTGVGGYVAMHVTAGLLNQGYEVLGTVRSSARADAVKAAISSSAWVDKLSFVELDLLRDRGWSDAMEGCDYVMHIASPFFLAEPRDENDMIKPAVGGTIRVLSAAKRAGVKRAVVTSSVVAMTSGLPNGRYGADAWSDVGANIGAYAKSKTLAERAAWDCVAGGSMELVVINPGFILGPPLGSSADGQSVSMISDLIAGKMPMIPDVAMSMVDVRDVAQLHVAALQVADAAGRRFVAASEEPVAMAQLASVLKAAGYSKVPSRKAPNFAIKLMSLFDREAKGMLPQLGVRISYETRQTRDILQWQETPLEKTFVDMAKAISK